MIVMLYQLCELWNPLGIGKGDLVLIERRFGYGWTQTIIACIWVELPCSISQLSKMDCNDTVGLALISPSGQMDLSLWERLLLSLGELSYWPPQDAEVGGSNLSLPGPGLLAECLTFYPWNRSYACAFYTDPCPNPKPAGRPARRRLISSIQHLRMMSKEIQVDSCSRGLKML